MSSVWADEALAPDLLPAAPGMDRWASPFATERPVDPPQEQERIGDDDRTHVAGTLAVPYRWICSLDVTFDPPYPRGWSSGFARGSGLLVGPRQVLTAAHTIYPDGQTRPASVFVAPGRNGRRDPFGRVKAVAYSVSSNAFGRFGIAREHDYAIVTLERDIAHERRAVLGDQPLGHWGHDRLGQGTVLRALGRDFLLGKRVIVCGYPGDRCGTAVYDPASRTCDKADQATTQWIHNGVVSHMPRSTRLLLHTADTAKGQSGSPVWIKFTNGRRYLVGVHVDAHRVTVDDKVRVDHNIAVHLSDHVLAMVRSWIP